MGHHYPEPHGYRDPIDNVPKKWVSLKSNPTKTAEVDPWAHIPDIKRPANNYSQPRTSSSPEHPKHISASSVVRKKVAKLASSQSSTSSSQKTSNVHRPAITGNEEFIVSRMLAIPDKEKLNLACSDSSREQFQALIEPLLNKLRDIIQGEIINPEHVLLRLRERLGIVIPKK